MEVASATQLEKRNVETSQLTDRSTNTTDQHLSVNKDAVAKKPNTEKGEGTIPKVVLESKPESSTGSQKSDETCRAKVAADKQPSSADHRKEDPDAKVKRSLVTPKDQMKTGDKGKRGKRKKKTNLPKITLKQQSPVMKRLTDFFPVRRSNRRCKSSIEVEEKKRLEESILTGQEEGLESREIDGKGRGVVATRDFAKGQFVVEYYGDLIDVTKAKELEAKYGMDPSIGCYMYYFEFKNKRYCVDATKESGRLGRLLNHSKTGNCCTKLVPIQSKPHLILVAKRDIKDGEELLYDYGDRSKEVLESHPWLAS